MHCSIQHSVSARWRPEYKSDSHLIFSRQQKTTQYCQCVTFLRAAEKKSFSTTHSRENKAYEATLALMRKSIFTVLHFVLWMMDIFGAPLVCVSATFPPYFVSLEAFTTSAGWVSFSFALPWRVLPADWCFGSQLWFGCFLDMWIFISLSLLIFWFPTALKDTAPSVTYAHVKKPCLDMGESVLQYYSRRHRWNTVHDSAGWPHQTWVTLSIY